MCRKIKSKETSISFARKKRLLHLESQQKLGEAHITLDGTVDQRDIAVSVLGVGVSTVLMQHPPHLQADLRVYR